MVKPRSYSVAPGDAANNRILSWGALLGVITLAIVSMALVFPRTDLLTTLRRNTSDTNRELTLAYLRNIIRTEPEDLGLQLLLAEKLLADNDLLGARKVLDAAMALAQRSVKTKTAWDAADTHWWRARLRQAQNRDQASETTQVVAELLVRLKRSIPTLNSPNQVITAAGAALELRAVLGESTGQAVRSVQSDIKSVMRTLFAKLQRLPNSTPAELGRGAALALANGEFEPAAELYFSARRKTVSGPLADQLLQQGVRALLATGQPLLAWQAAMRETTDLPAADPLRWWLAELALGAAQVAPAAVQIRQVVPLALGPGGVAAAVPFEKLQLAWDTFASAADLPAALVVIDAALLLKPFNPVWLERKAQVSEWAGQSQQALAAWLMLLKRDVSERALANVFRLSPLLYDGDALLLAWRVVARQRALTLEEIRKVIAVYEDLGSVDGALGFVRQLPATQPMADPANKLQWQSLEAQLLGNAGRPEQAIAIFERARVGGMQIDDAKRLAQLYMRRGDLALALRALLSARLEETTPFDQAYWSLVADLAYETADFATAARALDKLLTQGQASTLQASRAVRIELNAGRIDQALVLAGQLYPRFPDSQLVDVWLETIAQQASPTGLRQFLAALLPQQRAQLEAAPDFLSRRAGLYARLGDWTSAIADYQQCLTLRPGDASTRASYWWLLIDRKNTAVLRRELTQFSAQARNNPAYGDVTAVAWQVLGESQAALAAMAPLLKKRANDFLWVMNYADLLERTGRQSVAVRVRRHAWRLAQRAASNPTDSEQARQALLVQLRLANSLADGEYKMRLWRQLGKLLSNGTDNALQKQQLQEVVGAWLLSEGRFDTAQRWLWQQQAQRMMVPGYQQLALALSQGDTDDMARVLERPDRPGDSLDPQDRAAAARQLGRRDEAATLGSQYATSLAEGPNDDAQQVLQEDLLATASRLTVHQRTRSAGPFKLNSTVLNGTIFIAPRLKLTLTLTDSSYRSNDSARPTAAVAEREARVGIDMPTPLGDVKAQALLLGATAQLAGLYLQLSHKLNSDAVLQLELARGERADDNSALAVSGLRDRLAGSLNLRLNDRLDVQASLTGSRLRTSTGLPLGQSGDAGLTGNWYLRRDYPDVRLQAQIRRSTANRSPQPSLATGSLQPIGSPAEPALSSRTASTAVSASLGVGLAQSDPAVYSRAWRPWGEVGFETRQAAGGWQTQPLLRLGIKGSVAGRDQLSINLDVRPATGAATGAAAGAEATHEFRLQYDVFFDR